jgi:hypothetical protein
VSADRVIVLSRAVPCFAHTGRIVLAHLLEQLAICGADLQFAVAGNSVTLEAEDEARLARAGVRAVEGPAPLFDGIDPKDGPARRLARFVGEAVDPRLSGDGPRFRDPDAEVERLMATGARSALLFWDTYYERLAPALSRAGMRLYGYLARPPMAASQVHARNELTGLKRALTQARLQGRERRHLARLRSLSDARNICALDAAWYDHNGVSCSYLPNTWPDAYGDAWQSLRRTAESRRRGIHILGNIGPLTATGNFYGMSYLADSVLPILERKLATSDWVINICGTFELPPVLDRLRRQSHVAVRGYVPDIDEEMLGNHIYLLLNNAGPYPGGYTRVIYAFSSGSCLIAHSRLAQSMPELVHDQNCLLADTPEGVADLIAAAATDSRLRGRIGAAGRETYLSRYQPKTIARGVLAMMSETDRSRSTR